MITLDQIKQLDRKVRKAIDKINSLKNENNMLQGKLDNYQLRIEELEVLIDTFKEDQGEIENGIIGALNQLDLMEEDTSLTGRETGLTQESAKSEQESSDETNAEPAITEETTPEAVETDKKEDIGKEESELDIF